jgi:hypothetical protein
MTGRIGTVLAGGLLLALAGPGCATTRLLRLENDVLKKQVAELEGQLATAGTAPPSEDFASSVDMETLTRFLARAGFTHGEPAGESLVTLPIEGRNTDFQLSVQLFPREKVLYFAVHDYLTLEDAASSQSMVLLLTQLVTMNYELLLGKFQLNPRSGEISLSVEVQVDDGLGFATFEAVLNHIIYTADQRHPDLLQAARGRGI